MLSRLAFIVRRRHIRDCRADERAALAHCELRRLATTDPNLSWLKPDRTMAGGGGGGGRGEVVAVPERVQGSRVPVRYSRGQTRGGRVRGYPRVELGYGEAPPRYEDLVKR
jgi:hypothetical protein